MSVQFSLKIKIKVNEKKCIPCTSFFSFSLFNSCACIKIECYTTRKFSRRRSLLAGDNHFERPFPLYKLFYIKVIILCAWTLYILQNNVFTAKFCTYSNCKHIVDAFVNTSIIHQFRWLGKKLTLKLLTISMGVLLYLALNYLFFAYSTRILSVFIREAIFLFRSNSTVRGIAELVRWIEAIIKL